jgi:beta-lactamase regulating signal transducer with metallopeptidase domain
MEDLSFLELVFVAAALSTIITVPLFLIVLTITGPGRRWLAPWARQTLWSLVLVRLLLPVSFGSPASLQPTAIWLFKSGSALLESANSEPQNAVAHMYSVDAAEPWAVASPTPGSPAPGSVAQPPLDWFEFTLSVVLPCILLSGMLLVAVWTVITTVRLRRLVRSGTDCQREDWLALLAEGREEFRIRRKVTLRTLPALTSPATCGVWRPAILLPEGAESWSTVELRHVVWHELAHIRRFDVAANWVLAVVRMLHWWNPLFWYAQRAWLAEREIACDALVLRHLVGHQAGEYGRTILRFLERLSAGHRGLPTSAAPGFVLFLGRKQAVRRRLAQLAKQTPRAPVWRRLLTGGLIAALGLAGLTDAASPETTARNPAPLPVRFELPAGTTWKIVGPEPSDSAESLLVKTYDLTSAIARLRQDDPRIQIPAAAIALQQFLQAGLGFGDGKPMTESGNSAPPGSRSDIRGTLLVVHASSSQHAAIEELLDRWTQHGLRQISNEVRMLTTSLSLKSLLNGSGGQVLNGGRSDGASQTLSSESLFDQQAWMQQSSPFYKQVLSQSECDAIIQRLQNDPHSNLMFCPKVTTIDGVSFTIQSGMTRPFVTAVETDDAGAVSPRFTMTQKGIGLKLQSLVEEDGRSSNLHLFWLQSELTDVELLETRSSERTVTLQVPHFSQTSLRTSTRIPAGHSLLVVPLRRNAQGHLMMCLVTPRVLTAEGLK